ncbi:MAG: DUF3486 family protein [Planctomycetaceae bacterium]|nr:DUF3486 family protein [Planctomycetaceae bacterium]
MARRTHSTIDTLPADLRETITRMVVDAEWPKDFPWEKSDINPEQYGKAKPRYEDIALYCAFCGHKISRSAVGRWAKELQTYERMRLAAGIAKRAMAGVTKENASETQRAAAEMLTAHVIDLASRDELDPKEVLMLSASTNELGKLIMKSDKYIREQIAAKVKTASGEIKETLTAAGVAKVVQKRIDEVLMGITKS